MAEKKSLVSKLVKVMKRVKNIPKRGYNSFHKYYYATEADVAENVRDALAEQNVLMITSILEKSYRETITRSGNKEYIYTVTMEFIFIDGDSGEELKFVIVGEGQDAGDKGIYKAITGAQKYALMKTFLIPTYDDPESDTNSEKPTKPQNANKANKATDNQIKAIYAIANDFKVSEDALKEWVSKVVKREIDSLKELSKSEASSVIKGLERHKAAKGELKFALGQG